MRPTCVSRRRSKVVSRCFGIVLGKTPGTILFMLPQAEAVPCTHSWEPTTAVLLPLSLRTSARTGVAIRFPFCRGTFFPRRKKVPKERRQNQGFGILFAAGVSSTSVSFYLADRDVQNLHLAFAWSLRRHPLAAHAGPCCPDAAGIHFASAVLCATFLVIVS